MSKTTKVAARLETALVDCQDERDRLSAERDRYKEALAEIKALSMNGPEELLGERLYRVWQRCCAELGES